MYELPQMIFDFNSSNYNEKFNRVVTTPVSVSLVEDRFGNESSALYLHGHAHSYLNLGTSGLLKPKPVSYTHLTLPTICSG